MAITLKAARVNAGLSQKKAAEKIGVSVDTLGKWERGICFPNVISAKKAASTYGMNFDDIIFSKQITV